MKIRIKGNSLRYRLTRSEVDLFGTQGYIEETTGFGSRTLTYALQSIAEGISISAEYNNDKITMMVPEAIARQWTTTEKVGFDARVPIGNGEELYLLLEKDFKCLDETMEDQSDNFDNPLASRA